MNFSIIDWIIVTVYLLLMLAIGYLASRKNKTAEDYILGGKTMKPFMVGVSLFATLFSTLSYLSYPGEMIKHGPVFLAGILALPLANWIVGKFLIPRFMKMNVKSAYEMLEIRLGANTRKLAVLFFLCLRFLWMTTIMYATVDIALVPILNIDRSLVPYISLVLSILTVVYTTMGGMKAVVKTDVAQSFIMFLGLILTIIFVISQLSPGQSLFNPSIYTHWEPISWGIHPNKRMTVGNIIILILVIQVCTAGSDQMAIQRYLSTKNSKEAASSYNISLWGGGLIKILLAITGICVMAFFFYNPDMMGSGGSIHDHADSLFPLYIRVGLPPGLTGLITAALLAAAMSSLSSGLNSSSTVILEDIFKNKRGRKKPSKNNSDLKLIKRISFILGIAVALSIFFLPYVTGNLFDVIQKVVNLVVAPLFVLFFMALFVPNATERSTICAGLFSLLTAISIAFWGIFGISSLWVTTFSLIAGIILGLLLSLINNRLIILRNNREKM
ncbi:MAG: sodium:solute symporter family transporter [Fermentimonas sp.]